MKMKKIITILLTMTLVFSLAACNKKDTATSDTNSGDTNATQGAVASSNEVVTLNFYEHTDNEAIATALVDA